MARLPSPKKGAELLPRIFAAWQAGVNREVHALQDIPVRLTLEAFSFLNTSIPAHSELDVMVAATGAVLGAAVLITPDLESDGTPPPDQGLIVSAYVGSAGTLVVRGFNVSPGAFTPQAVDYEVLIWNP